MEETVVVYGMAGMSGGAGGGVIELTTYIGEV